MMKGPLTITSAEIAPILDIAQLIDPVREAFIALSAGKADAPVAVLHPTNQSDMHVKSAVIDGWPIFTIKTAGWSEILQRRGQHPSSGMIAVFDARTCLPVALLHDDHLISDYRTAAAGSLAAQAMARQDARKALIIGTGTQAYLQAHALTCVRQLETISIWGRSAKRQSKLAEKLAANFPEKGIVATTDLKRAVHEADIIVTATSAREPVIEGDWLRPGQHVTSVGADDTTKSELDAASLLRADILAVDALDAAWKYGNLNAALKNGLAKSRLAPVEIGHALTGSTNLRSSDKQITVASFVGLGVQDLAAVNFILSQIERYPA